MNRQIFNVTAKAEKRAVDATGLDRSQHSLMVLLLGASGDNVSCRACKLSTPTDGRYFRYGGDAAVSEDLGQVEAIPTIAKTVIWMTVMCGS